MSNVTRLLLCESGHETSITFLKVYREDIFLQPIYLRVCVSEGLFPVHKNSYTLLTSHPQTTHHFGIFDKLRNGRHLVTGLVFFFLRSPMSWDVLQCSWLLYTDVLEQPIGPIFNLLAPEIFFF